MLNLKVPIRILRLNAVSGMGALQGTFTGFYEDYHLGLPRVPCKGILLEWGSPFCFVKGLPWEAHRHGRNSRDFGSGFGG